MTFYLLQRDDGGVSILRHLDLNKSVDSIVQDLDFNVLTVTEIQENQIPASRAFRNAWEFDAVNSKIAENPDKCRTIIRQKRDTLLLVLDDKALAESRKPNGDLTAINAEAQRLRDIPQQANFASDDVEVLRTVLADTDLRV